MPETSLSPYPRPPKTETTDAILMASGFSTRFGAQNKMLAPFCGTPLAMRALSLVCATPIFGKVFFVCSSPDVAQLARGFPATVIHNENPGRGSCESIRLGVSASYADYYLFVPCDQPLLDDTTLRKIWAQRRPGKIISPYYGQTPGAPALFSAHFRKELLHLQDGQNAREIKNRHPASVQPLPLASGLPLMDVDTPEDLARLEQIALANEASSRQFN